MTAEETIRQLLEEQKASYLAQLQAAKEATQKELLEQKTAAQDEIDAKARDLDSQLTGFLTGAIAPAYRGENAGVLTRDPLLGKGSAPPPGKAPQKASMSLWAVAAAIGAYFYFKKRKRR